MKKIFQIMALITITLVNGEPYNKEFEKIFIGINSNHGAGFYENENNQNIIGIKNIISGDINFNLGFLNKLKPRNSNRGGDFSNVYVGYGLGYLFSGKYNEDSYLGNIKIGIRFNKIHDIYTNTMIDGLVTQVGIGYSFRLIKVGFTDILLDFNLSTNYYPTDTILEYEHIGAIMSGIIIRI